MISGNWGDDYLSTRIVKREAGQIQGNGNATLAEDLEAEGGDTRQIWLFQRLDEVRMLRMWGHLRGNAATNMQKRDAENSFRTMDMVLAAGRGFDVEPNPGATATGRGKGMLALAGVATSGSALASRAEHYLKSEHW